MTKPVADYTPCEWCGHALALHSDRGCHVITEMLAPKHKPNETCACRPGQAELVAKVVPAAPKGKPKAGPPKGKAGPPKAPPVRDEKSALVDQQQQWLKERR